MTKKLFTKLFIKPSSFVLLFCASLAISNTSMAQTMSDVGSPGFSSGACGNISLDINASNTPYVAFTDSANAGKLTVMKYNGSAWTVVGSAGVSSGVAITPAIAIDKSNGTPYVVFSDATLYNNLTVMKYNGSAWVTVGTAGFTPNEGDNPSIIIDHSGTPYIAFTDWNATTPLAGTVMKFNGTAWAYVGLEGFTPGQANDCIIKTDASGTPYMLFGDDNASQKLSMMKYNGSSWSYVGNAGFSTSVAFEPSMTLTSGGNIYVGFSDWSMSPSQKATVMKYNGSTWSILGSAGFSTGTVFTPSIAVNAGGTPYIAYRDVALSNKAVLMTYNGSAWQEIGGTGGFSTGASDFISMALDGLGNPYVAFADGTLGNKTTVMRDALVSGVNAVQGNKQRLSAYPNPNTGSFTVEYSGNGTCVVSNLLGQVIRRVEFNGNNSRINVEHLNTGIYFISINGNPSTVQKIIVNE